MSFKLRNQARTNTFENVPSDMGFSDLVNFLIPLSSVFHIKFKFNINIELEYSI